MNLRRVPFWVAGILGFIVLFSAVFGYECTGDVVFWATLNETAEPMIESCVGDNLDVVANWASDSGVWNNSVEIIQPGNSYITEGNQISLPANYTISFWVNCTTVPTAAMFVVSGGDPTCADVNLKPTINFQNTGALRLMHGDGAGAFDLTSTTAAIAVNTWYHVVGRANGTRISIWLNATENSSAAQNHVAPIRANNYSIGRYGECNLNYVDECLIDEVVIVSQALNDTEINNLFTGNNITGAGPPPVPGNVGCNVTTWDYNITNGSIAAGWTPQNGSASRPLVVNYSLTCYDIDSYTCSFIQDGVHVGDNATALVNNSFNYINTNVTWPDSGASYQANVTCTNTTFGNSSANTTLSVDGNDPLLNITVPLNVSYFVGTNVTLNFTFTELNPNECWYRLNGSANSTISYNNGTNLTGGNLTADIGEYHVELWCNDNALNLGFGEQWFSVTAVPVITNITSYPFQVQWSGCSDCWTSRECVGDLSRTHYSRWLELNGTAYNVTFYEDVFCEMGCQGNGVCLRSWLRLDPWLGMGLVLVLAVALIYLAVYKRRWI